MKIIDSATTKRFAHMRLQAMVCLPETWVEPLDARIYVNGGNQPPWAVTKSGKPVHALTIESRTYGEFAFQVDSLITQLEALKVWAKKHYQSDWAAQCRMADVAHDSTQTLHLPD